MPLNLNTAMDAIGTALGGITGLRVYDYPSDNIAVPAAVVAWPDELEYDHTHARGVDRAVFRVHVLVGKVSDRAARDQINAYTNGAGAANASVKTALDAIGPHVRVGKVAFTVMTVAGLEYLTATFDVDYVA